MRESPIGWILPLVALGGVLLAVVEYRTTTLLVLGAAIALSMGIGACVQVLTWELKGDRPVDLQEPADPAGVRAYFLSGRSGREELLARLELLQPAAQDDPATRSAESRRSLLTGPESEFLRYLGWRIARIDGAG